MTTSASIQITGNGKAVDPVETGRQLAEEQHYRVDAYRLIATMLRTPPDALFLDQLSRLSRVEAPDELSLSVSMLGLAARASGADAVNDEFHRLFIGLGRGELVPYASWYLTGFLMEKPLGELRRHLAEMGFERQNGVCEPEDHIAALCEVMSILVLESRPHAETAGFFEAHLAPWSRRFFDDLSRAQGAVFYRNVGRFGAAFFELERRYYAMQL